MRWMQRLGLWLLVLGFVPGFGDLADARDSFQNATNGDWGEAALDAVSFFPVIGTAADGARTVDFANDSVKKFPSQTDTLTKLFIKHVVPHMPDSLAVKLLNVFSGGKASKRNASGKSTDEEIERAKNGKLSKPTKKSGRRKPKNDPNQEKRYVADDDPKISKNKVSNLNKYLGI